MTSYNVHTLKAIVQHRCIIKDAAEQLAGGAATKLMLALCGTSLACVRKKANNIFAMVIKKIYPKALSSSHFVGSNQGFVHTYSWKSIIKKWIITHKIDEMLCPYARQRKYIYIF